MGFLPVGRNGRGACHLLFIRGYMIYIYIRNHLWIYTYCRKNIHTPTELATRGLMVLFIKRFVSTSGYLGTELSINKLPM